MKRLSSFDFVPQTAGDQSRQRERYSSASGSNENVHDDQSTQRAMSPEPGPSPRVPVTTGGGYAEERSPRCCHIIPTP